MGQDVTDVGLKDDVCWMGDPLVRVVVYTMATRLGTGEVESSCSGEHWAGMVQSVDDPDDFAAAALTAFGTHWTSLPNTEDDPARDTVRYAFSRLKGTP